MYNFLRIPEFILFKLILLKCLTGITKGRTIYRALSTCPLGVKIIFTRVHFWFLSHILLKAMFLWPNCATNCEVWGLSWWPSGWVSMLPPQGAWVWSQSGKFCMLRCNQKIKKKFFFSKVYNKTCENIIWVRAESLLCGHWCEDREAGWGLSCPSVQSHLSCFLFPSLCVIYS